MGRFVVQQAGLQRGGHQGFEVAAANLGVGVLAADHLALLGQSDLPVHGARRLGKDRLVAGATAPAHRTAPAVKQAQRDAVLRAQRAKQRHQSQLGVVELPVAGKETAILVAVAVAQHDFLLAAAAQHQLGDAGQGVELAHDGGGQAQVTNGFKQRHDDQRAAGIGVQRADHQAAFFEQQQQLQQVAHRLGVADDAVAQRLAAVARQHLAGGLEHVQLAQRQLAVLGTVHPQGARIVQQSHQQRAAGGLVERRVILMQPSRAQQLGQHRLVLVRALAQIHGGQVKAEHLHRAHQRGQSRGHQGLGVVRLQAGGDQLQVSQKLGRAGVGVLSRHCVAQRLGAGQCQQRGRQPGVDADQRAAVGLVFTVRVLVRRSLGQGLHRRRHPGQHLADRQLGTQRVGLGQIKAQRHLALARQGHAQGVAIDIRVAVAVAANPLAHAQKGRNGVAGQMVFQLAVQLGNLAQKRALVVAQRVLDLVSHRQLGVAQHACLPELGDAGPHQRLVVAALTLAGQGVAFTDQLGNRAFSVQDALALHLGGVGGENRCDVRLGQQLGHVGSADVGAVQALKSQRQRAFLLMALGRMVQATAHMVAILGDVGQMRKVAEGPDHAHSLVGRQVFQQAVQHPAGRGILFEPVAHRQLPHPLDQLESLFALLLADHIAQDATQ